MAQRSASGTCAGGPPGSLAGLRSTRQRRAVLDAVERLGVFSGARAVHDDLGGRSGHVALSTVYRTLRALAERGTIDAVRGRDGETRYRKCGDAPHHHLVCRGCGTTVELSQSAVSPSVRRWAREAGYADLEQVLDVFGTCSQCQSRTD
jgi:Fur family ferric uptake transcriptional regulator